jgi:hypothetical protein
VRRSTTSAGRLVGREDGVGHGREIRASKAGWSPELLNCVRDRASDESEPDPLGPLEDHSLERHRNVSPDGRAVGGEHHARGVLEDIDVAPELRGCGSCVRRRGNIENDVSRRSQHHGHRSERPYGAAAADVERQLAANRSADGNRHPSDEGPNGAQQDPASRRRAHTRHAGQLDPSGPCVKGECSNRWSDVSIVHPSTQPGLVIARVTIVAEVTLLGAAAVWLALGRQSE